jgi:DNA-binding YbaB/EbfC family protein
MKRGGMGNMQQMMQQARQMQAKMEKIQEELGKQTVETAAGGGAVKVVMSGKQELVSIKISKEAMESGDPEMLEDMVKAAINEGTKKAKELSESAMGGALGNIPLPPGLF